MTLPKAKPCPICGNIYTELYAYENGWQHVECDECYYLGPGEGNALQAIRSHNAASAMSAGTAATPKSGAGLQPASAVPERQTPTPSHGEQAK